MLPAIILVAVLLYSVTTLVLWFNTKYNKNQFSFYFVITWVLAIIAHAYTVQASLLVDGGVDLSFFNSLSLSMLLLSTVFLAVCFSQPLMTLGLIIFPLAATSIVLEYININGQSTINVNPGMQIHIISSLLAYTFLNLAFIQALAIYIQDWRLKHSSLLGYLGKLPPLIAMENFLFILLVIGVFLLSLGLATGWLYHEDLFAQHLVHKTVLSIIAWIFFVIVLSGHILWGWRGKLVWKTVFSGFLFLLLAYFGSKFALELILNRT